MNRWFHPHDGDWFWIGLAGWLLAWNGNAFRTGGEQATLACQRHGACPRQRPFVIGAIATTALHLLGLLPAHLDPLNHLGRLLGRLVTPTGGNHP